MQFGTAAQCTNSVHRSQLLANPVRVSILSHKQWSMPGCSGTVDTTERSLSMGITRRIPSHVSLFFHSFQHWSVLYDRWSAETHRQQRSWYLMWRCSSPYFCCMTSLNATLVIALLTVASYFCWSFPRPSFSSVATANHSGSRCFVAHSGRSSDNAGG